MPLSETLAQGLAKRVTYLFNDCMSKSIGKSKDYLRTRPAGNCSPPRGPHRSCDSALLSQHTTFEFHEGEPGHALHIACYPKCPRPWRFFSLARLCLLVVSPPSAVDTH